MLVDGKVVVHHLGRDGLWGVGRLHVLQQRGDGGQVGLHHLGEVLQLLDEHRRRRVGVADGHAERGLGLLEGVGSRRVDALRGPMLLDEFVGEVDVVIRVQGGRVDQALEPAKAAASRATSPKA